MESGNKNFQHRIESNNRIQNLLFVSLMKGAKGRIKYSLGTASADGGLFQNINRFYNLSVVTRGDFGHRSPHL